MIVEGTIVDGHVELDAPADLPNGTRVRLTTAEDSWDDLPPPAVSESREEFLESLRESVAESKAGVRGIEARQFMKEMNAKFGLPSGD